MSDIIERLSAFDAPEQSSEYWRANGQERLLMRELSKLIGEARAEITRLRAENERLDIDLDAALEKLQKIGNWANAYPPDIFTEVSDSDLDDVRAKIGDTMMTRLHSSWGRHILEGVKKILEHVQ